MVGTTTVHFVPRRLFDKRRVRQESAASGSLPAIIQAHENSSHATRRVSADDLCVTGPASVGHLRWRRWRRHGRNGRRIEPTDLPGAVEADYTAGAGERRPGRLLV